MINRKFINGARFYECPSGDYPGVTTILSATKPEEDRRSLAAWRKRVGEAEANRITRESCARGTAIHSLCEHVLRGGSVTPDEIPDGVGGYWQSIAPEIGKLDPQCVEHFVYSDAFRYAGTLDFLGRYNGRTAIVDFKTSSSPKRIEWVCDYCLQGVAYAAAAKEQGVTNGVELLVLIVALPDRPAQVIAIDRCKMMDYWTLWQQRLAEFYRGWVGCDE